MYILYLLNGKGSPNYVLCNNSSSRIALIVANVLSRIMPILCETEGEITPRDAGGWWYEAYPTANFSLGGIDIGASDPSRLRDPSPSENL